MRRLILRNLILYAVLATVVGLIAFGTGTWLAWPKEYAPGVPFSQRAPRVGERAPNPALRFPDGSPFDLGKQCARAPVVLEFLCLS